MTSTRAAQRWLALLTVTASNALLQVRVVEAERHRRTGGEGIDTFNLGRDPRRPLHIATGLPYGQNHLPLPRIHRPPRNVLGLTQPLILAERCVLIVEAKKPPLSSSRVFLRRQLLLTFALSGGFLFFQLFLKGAVQTGSPIAELLTATLPILRGPGGVKVFDREGAIRFLPDRQVEECFSKTGLQSGIFATLV